MRRFGKWFLIALGSLLVLLAIVITLTIGWSPFLGPKARALTNRTFERTPQRLERGRYIATGLSGCVYCHSPHDWTAPGTPINGWQRSFRRGSALRWSARAYRGAEPYPRSGNRSGQLDR